MAAVIRLPVLCRLHGGPAEGEVLEYDEPPEVITVRVQARLGKRLARYQRVSLAHYECVEEHC